MRRRDFVAGAAGAALWPFSAVAQQPPMPVIGLLSIQSAAIGPAAATIVAFRQGLRETGFTEGRDVSIEYRWADGHEDRLPGLAADLVSRRVNVILTSGGPTPTLAAKAATSTIPIVFWNGSDPVKAGLVASLSHPGGNVTGFTFLTAVLGPKKLELLHELLPASTDIGMLVNPDDADSLAELEQVETAAKSLGLRLHIVSARAKAEFEGAFAALARQKVAALLVSTGTLFGTRPTQIAGLAARQALPAIGDRRDFAVSGGLISYGTSFAAVARRAGVYVGRILKGEKPADLPVQQADKFELVINLNTAKALGITVSQSLLARADEVIE